jgi:REP element-mobilizing transposase RayT
MSAKQSSFFKPARSQTLRWWIENQQVYGGALNYRKVQRPFDSKKLAHVVFKATLGHGVWFTKSERSIVRLMKQMAQRYSIKIKSFSVQKDHIHVLLYPESSAHPRKAKENFQNFLRLFSSQMGRKYKMIFKKLGIQAPKSIWTYRPFTRLVSWGKKSLNSILKYIEKNTLEALGFVQYSNRNHRLDLFLKKFSQEWRV